MDSWENVVLQWINCLLEDKVERITNLEQLEDGVIYYKLISKIKPWDSTEYHGNEREVLLQFLQNEYPKFLFNNKNHRIKSLSVASLLLSRLSLESVFHKSMCTNLSDDMQIKIKLILESIYPLGKNVTEDDFFKIFSLNVKPDLESPIPKPRFLLEEFLKSPIMRTVHSDSKIHDQSRQLRRLRAEIETVTYEKSELIEDIKTQEKQIKELQKKLHDTLIELKSLRQVNYQKIDKVDFIDKTNGVSPTDLNYKKEVESLESYVVELQNENVQLQDEKINLSDKVKAFKEKYNLMKEKNKNNEEALESMMYQLEKKEEELMELKLRHDELCNHLKEKSKILYNNNLSCEYDDKTFNESCLDKSWNRSEALSSVVEIQLQELRKELTIVQNNFKFLNSVLTALIEEYYKLKLNCQLTIAESSSVFPTNIIEDYSKKILFFDVTKNLIDPIKKSKDFSLTIIKEKHTNDLSDENEKLKIIFRRDRQNKLTKADKFTSTFHNVFWQKHWDKYLFVYLKDILQEITKLKSTGKHELNITTNSVIKYKNFTSNDFYLELLKFIKNNCDVKIQYSPPKESSTTSTQTDVKSYTSTLIQTDVKDYSSVYIQTDTKQFLSKDSQTDVKNYFTTFSQTDVKNYFTTSAQTEIKEYLSIPVQTEEKISFSMAIQTEEDVKVSLLSQDELESIQTNWNQLSDSIQNDTEIYKTLSSLLEEKWNFTLKSFKEVTNNYESHGQSELGELFTAKDTIENDIKDLYSKNHEFLLTQLSSSVQLITTLKKNSNVDLDLFSEKSNVTENFPKTFLDQNKDNAKLNNEELSNKIMEIKQKIENFDSLLKEYQEKLRCTPVVEKDNISKDVVEIPTKLTNEDISQSLQFQNYMKETHEKYESKLEKMKEKMKSAFNQQIMIAKKEQEIALIKQAEALQTKFEYQCHNHTEDLKKYKNHITELTTQLWDVGEKLIIEKQKKEEYYKKLKELQAKHENIENFNVIMAPPAAIKPKIEKNLTSQQTDISYNNNNNNNNNIQNVRGFQIMGNAFSNEDEEGEVFDTTYLADMQKPRESLSTVDINRLSILQQRNSKCQPHLKSSYPAEVEYLPATLTEDDIKSGNPDEFLNDSLSQSLLTGEKVKRKIRAKNNSETPRRTRRFSNIFRKPKLVTDHK